MIPNQLKRRVNLDLFAGIVVKSHYHREGHKNRPLAREILVAKLDEHFNGDQCIAAQIKRIEEAREKVKDEKAAKLRELKRQFKEREGLK